MAIILGLLLFGIAMIVAGVGMNAAGMEIGALATSFLLGGGGLFAIGSSTLLIFQKLYVKTTANMAFVRTGTGGFKVVMDGGAIVIPFLHEIIFISLSTHKIEVRREGKDAFLTKDFLRADVRAEFYVKVPATSETIRDAARSFTGGMRTSADLQVLVEEKVGSALRTVANGLTLNELNSNREQFRKTVMEELTETLTKNGLTLEDTTISKLDQTSPEFLSMDNIFDAQGRRAITVLTEAEMTKTNEAQRNGELARKQRDVETRKLLLAQEQDQQIAEAEQSAAITRAKAEREAEVKKSAAEQERIAREKQIETQRLVQLADVKRQQEIEVAEQTRQQAVAVAAEAQKQAVVAAQQQVEVAERAKEQAIAVAETQRTQAETERAEAEAKREEARQAITTVEQVAAAEREKKRAVIAAEGEAEKRYIEQKRTADANAYAKTAEADADKAAAQASAAATVAKANADRDAQIARAEGLKAEAMVPVEVKRSEVEVDRDRVETVLKPELAAREQSGKIAQEFELEKLRIAAMQVVKTAVAEHSSKIFHGMNAKLFGTPDDVARAYKSFQDGNAGMEVLNGVMAALPPAAQAQVQATIAALAKKIGVELPEATQAPTKDASEDAGTTENAS